VVSTIDTVEAGIWLTVFSCTFRSSVLLKSCTRDRNALFCHDPTEERVTPFR
jgi:hypothetical protein